MKRLSIRKTIFLLLIACALLAVLVMFGKFSSDQNQRIKIKAEAGGDERHAQSNDAYRAGADVEKQPNSRYLSGIEVFVVNISRGICRSEHAVIEDSLQHRPQDSKALIQILHQISTSKCSAFRRNNAQGVLKQVADEGNFRQVLSEINVLLGEYPGPAYQELFRAAIAELSQASAQEGGPLRKAILYALSNQILDSSRPLDLLRAASALGQFGEKDLILRDLSQPARAFQQDLNDKGMQLIRKHAEENRQYPGIGLETTFDEMANILGPDGVNMNLQHLREEFELNEQYRAKLMDLVGPYLEK